MKYTIKDQNGNLINEFEIQDILILPDILSTNLTKFSKKVNAEIQKWYSQGFTKQYIFEGKQDLQKLLKLADYENPAWIYEPVKEAKSDKRPDKYLLLYTKDIPQETKGKTPIELEKLFKEKDWKGMTIEEYLVIQRFEFKKRKDHSFDSYNYEISKSNWTYLLGSKNTGFVVKVCWFPENRLVSLDSSAT